MVEKIEIPVTPTAEDIEIMARAIIEIRMDGFYDRSPPEMKEEGIKNRLRNEAWLCFCQAAYEALVKHHQNGGARG